MTIKTRMLDLIDRRTVKQRGSYRLERRGPHEFVRVENSGCAHEMAATRVEWDMPEADAYVPSGMMSCPTCIQALATPYPAHEQNTARWQAQNKAAFAAMNVAERERFADIQRRSRANPDAPIWEIMPENAYAQALQEVEQEGADGWGRDWDNQPSVASNKASEPLYLLSSS